MGKKNKEIVEEAPEIVQEAPEIVQEAPEIVQDKEEVEVENYTDTSVVYDLSTLFEMKFMDPLNGQIVMVRRAFKPRGKLEFYCPEE